MLEYLAEPQALLAACRRLVGPDGRLVVSIINFESQQYEQAEKHHPGWIYKPSPDEFRQLLAANGLSRSAGAVALWWPVLAAGVCLFWPALRFSITQRRRGNDARSSSGDSRSWAACSLAPECVDSWLAYRRGSISAPLRLSSAQIAAFFIAVAVF